MCIPAPVRHRPVVPAVSLVPGMLLVPATSIVPGMLFVPPVPVMRMMPPMMASLPVRAITALALDAAIADGARAGRIGAVLSARTPSVIPLRGTRADQGQPGERGKQQQPLHRPSSFNRRRC
jgi:hypothetical protein